MCKAILIFGVNFFYSWDQNVQNSKLRGNLVRTRNFFAYSAFHVKCGKVKEMHMYIHVPCSALDSEIFLLPDFFAFWLPEVIAPSSICC